LLGALLPPLAALLGLMIGWRHWGWDPAEQIVFMFSVPALLAFLVFGMQGAGLGLWLWLGFALGDSVWAAGALHATVKPEMILAGRALQDLLLAGGLIGIPAAVAGLSQRLAGPARPGDALPLEGLLRAGLGFTLVWLWLLASAVQLQAVYTFAGMGARTHGLVASLAANGWAIALVGACAAVARGLAEKAAARVPDYAERLGSLRRTLAAAYAPDVPRTAAGVIAKAALATFALSTFLANWTQALILAAAIMLILGVRAFGLGGLGLGAQIAAVASLRVRLAAAVVVVSGVAWFMLRRNWAAANGFVVTLAAVLISLMVYAVLLPEGGARAQPGARPKSLKRGRAA
jgi:hypothetical protein